MCVLNLILFPVLQLIIYTFVKVKLKDFPSDPTYFAKVLDFCFNNKTDPDLIEKLKDEKLKEKLQDIDTKPTYNGTFYQIFLFVDFPVTTKSYHKLRGKSTFLFIGIKRNMTDIFT